MEIEASTCGQIKIEEITKEIDDLLLLEDDEKTEDEGTNPSKQDLNQGP